jgi:Fe-S oxidoreductase
MPVRETFWNIPHWAEIGQYILGLITIIIFVYGVSRRIRRWRMGLPERRLDQPAKRLWLVIVQAIGQFRTTQDAFAGIMHLSIFWGMFALLLGTILATVDWDVTHLFFNYQFLTGGVYVVYELVLDILGLLLMLGLGMAAYRRYVTRPARLMNPSEHGDGFAWEDAYALIMLALVAVTGYLVDWALWSPVGNALASLFSAIGDPANRALHLTLWISHALVAFVFIGSIPFTKLFHIVAAPANIFFSSLEPPGALAPPRQTGEVGVQTWQDFTWKQILDFDSCVRCGRCQDQCPAHASGMGLSPRNLMLSLHAHVWERAYGRALHGEVITAEALWACTSCRACVEACPVFADQLSAIVDMRRHLVIEGQVDTELQSALANLARYGNSFGKSDRMRARWTKPLQHPVKNACREAVEYLWFVGDYASYHASLTDLTARTAGVFQKIGLDFGILYADERNTGNDVRRVGEEGLFEMLVEINVTVLDQSEYQVIVTTDPHTYNTLKNEYPANGSRGRTVLHYTELLDREIASGRLEFKKRLHEKVTYHDPCYLGRYNDVYAAPRRLIEATGCELVEMPRCRERGFCCGAGGGRIWMEEPPTIQERPAESRVREAATLPGVSTLVVACPKDLVMFQDAIKTAGLEGSLVIKDVIELVEEALG